MDAIPASFRRVYCGIHGVYLEEGPAAIQRVNEEREDPWDLYHEAQRFYTATYTYAARRVIIVPQLGRRCGKRVEFAYDFRSLRIRHAGAADWTDLEGTREVFEPGERAGLRLVRECARWLFEEPGYVGGPAEWRRSAAALLTPAALAETLRHALDPDLCDVVLAFAGVDAYDLALHPPVAGLAAIRVRAPALSARELVVAAVAALERKTRGAARRELAALAASTHYLFGSVPGARMVAIPLSSRAPDAPTRALLDRATLVWSRRPESRKPLQLRFNVTSYESTRAMFVSRSRELVQR